MKSEAVGNFRISTRNCLAADDHGQNFAEPTAENDIQDLPRSIQIVNHETSEYMMNVQGFHSKTT